MRATEKPQGFGITEPLRCCLMLLPGAQATIRNAQSKTAVPKTIR